MERIILVSSRLPDMEARAQAGGVSVALADVVQRFGGIWCGWNGKVTAEDPTPVKRRRNNVTMVSTPLTEAEHSGFYFGYSNSVLWPVFHQRLDLAEFEAGYFQTYQGVNRRFASILAPLLKPDDTIWIHDYQLIPLGLELRKLGVTNVMGFFLHIPFPPAQSFLAVPEHLELGRSLAAYDLIGLQTPVDVSHLLDYFRRGASGRILPSGQMRVFERIVTIESFPIGIDPEFFEPGPDDVPASAPKPEVKRMIGIDRLDYSKGLPQKFRSFGRFLELAPQYRQQVVLTQIAPPTREDVDAYAEIRQQLELLSGSINGRHGDLDWVPIHYIRRPIARQRLPEIFRQSRIGLVTPLRDGMNLVAKEYVASQDPNDPGVLVLSRFAGAAEELDSAVIVNPYNIEETAQAMLQAIDMPLDERRARHASLLATIRHNNVTAWCDRFIDALRRNRNARAAVPSSFDEALSALDRHPSNL